MRVIAGSARRLLLKTVEGLDTRPTTDRIKETLFNVLQNDVPGCMFLDLFSGSGAIGIEALSRGASLAVLIEKNPKAAACIGMCWRGCAAWRGATSGLTSFSWIRPTGRDWSVRCWRIWPVHRWPRRIPW